MDNGSQNAVIENFFYDGDFVALKEDYPPDHPPHYGTG